VRTRSSGAALAARAAGNANVDAEWLSYTTTRSSGASGFTPSGSGNINNTVTMPPASSITYKATGTISAAATGSISDTATVTAPAGATDPNTANNSATDTDTL
jgi:hypothetical protein